jgi:plastocyanin
VGRLPLIVAALVTAAPEASTVTGHVTFKGQPVKGAEVQLELPNAPKRKPQTYTVSQKDRHFQPDLLIIRALDSVDFKNDEQDRTLHNVFSNSPPKHFDVGKPKPGETRTWTFETPGREDLFCDIHAQMKATLLIVPPGLATQADDTGTFTLKNVPPGTHHLDVWQGSALASADVTSAPGQVASVNLVLVEQAVPYGPHKNKFGGEYRSPDGGYR